jgi:hypothetical protein
MGPHKIQLDPFFLVRTDQAGVARLTASTIRAREAQRRDGVRDRVARVNEADGLTRHVRPSEDERRHSAHDEVFVHAEVEADIEADVSLVQWFVVSGEIVVGWRLVSRQHHHHQRPGRDRPAEADEDEQAESERAEADEDLEQAFATATPLPSTTRKNASLPP